MELKKCEFGHYYDGQKYSECPICKEAQSGGDGKTVPLSGLDAGTDTGKTMPVGGGFAGAETGKTMPIGGGLAGEPGKTMPLAGQGSAGGGYDAARTAPLTDGYVRPSAAAVAGGRTIAVIQQETGIDPVVGWLVGLTGSEKGRDYRIHSDNNFIGRGEKMDICIRGDETISRENHAVISYDPVDRCYYLARGEGRSIIRLNGRAMLEATRIEAYDVIEIGKTKLLFIPMCGERFEWSDER